MKITKEEFDQQKQDAIREWNYVKLILDKDPFYPLSGAKIKAMQNLDLKYGWRFGCFLCTLFQNGCYNCPLKDCFSNDSPYHRIEQAQKQLDNNNIKDIVLQCCDEILTTIKKLTYKETQNGTLNNSDNTEQL